MNSKLVLHRGGRAATRGEVFAVEAPPETHSWKPVAHGTVLAKVDETLQAAGYSIVRQQLGLSHGGDRFFGVLDLESSIIEGIKLALGLRNSINKSFPYGLAGGTRTFVCDNLALTGERDALAISRKHTRNGEQRSATASANLPSTETTRIVAFPSCVRRKSPTKPPSRSFSARPRLNFSAIACSETSSSAGGVQATIGADRHCGHSTMP